MRQDVAQLHTLHQDLMAAMMELKQSTAALATAEASRPPGPTDSEGVAEALRDPAARQEATKTYGIQWLTETKEKELWPADALKDDQFMAQYYQLKLSGIAGPSDSPLSTASTIADFLSLWYVLLLSWARLPLTPCLAPLLLLLQLALLFLFQLQLLANMSKLICQSPPA